MEEGVAMFKQLVRGVLHVVCTGLLLRSSQVVGHTTTGVSTKLSHTATRIGEPSNQLGLLLNQNMSK